MNGSSTKTFEYDGEVYSYSLVYSARRSLSVTITPTAEIIVRAPHQFPSRKVEDFLRDRSGWIRRKVRALAHMQTIPASRTYTDGETHVILGKRYTLKVVEGVKAGVAVCGEHLVLYRKEGSTRTNKSIFEAWLKCESRRLFEVRYRLGLRKFSYTEEPKLQLRMMISRWGSYRTGTCSIALNTRLIHMPIECLDYVIAHELCHHAHRDHSTRFYTLLAEKHPTYREDQKLLRSFCFR